MGEVRTGAARQPVGLLHNTTHSRGLSWRQTRAFVPRPMGVWPGSARHPHHDNTGKEVLLLGSYEGRCKSCCYRTPAHPGRSGYDAESLIGE